jgi:hypothetical protein
MEVQRYLWIESMQYGTTVAYVYLRPTMSLLHGEDSVGIDGSCELIIPCYEQFSAGFRIAKPYPILDKEPVRVVCNVELAEGLDCCWLWDGRSKVAVDLAVPKGFFVALCVQSTADLGNDGQIGGLQKG